MRACVPSSMISGVCLPPLPPPPSRTLHGLPVQIPHSQAPSPRPCRPKSLLRQLPASLTTHYQVLPRAWPRRTTPASCDAILVSSWLPMRPHRRPQPPATTAPSPSGMPGIITMTRVSQPTWPRRSGPRWLTPFSVVPSPPASDRNLNIAHQPGFVKSFHRMPQRLFRRMVLAYHGIFHSLDSLGTDGIAACWVCLTRRTINVTITNSHRVPFPCNGPSCDRDTLPTPPLRKSGSRGIRTCFCHLLNGIWHVRSPSVQHDAALVRNAGMRHHRRASVRLPLSSICLQTYIKSSTKLCVSNFFCFFFLFLFFLVCHSLEMVFVEKSAEPATV